MTFKLNTQDKAVQEFLNKAGIKYSATLILAGVKKSDDWIADQFTVSFAPAMGNHNAQSFEYNTGIGHRLLPVKGGYKMTVLDQNGLKEHKEITGMSTVSFRQVDGTAVLWVVAPTAASVLYCLISDMDCGSYTFADFCSNLGYDEDSRKANEIYLACQASGAKLRKVFTNKQIEALQELLQDY